MNVVSLTASDCRLLAARFAEHDNSHRRMASALSEAGACEAVARLVALRRLERRFGVDLADVCHRFLRREEPSVHPIERMVVAYITELRPDEGIWVLLDRIQQVRELMEGRLVGEPES